MKTLILSAGVSGTTFECGEKLSALIPGSELIKLGKNIPDPAGYDRIILGFSVRMGSIPDEMKRYIDFAADTLMSKPLGVFVCCGSDDEKAMEYIRSNMPDKLLDHAKVAMNFGGRLDPSASRGLDKLMMKLMLRSKQSIDMKLFPDRIAEFADIFTAEKIKRVCRKSGNFSLPCNVKHGN